MRRHSVRSRGRWPERVYVIWVCYNLIYMHKWDYSVQGTMIAHSYPALRPLPPSHSTYSISSFALHQACMRLRYRDYDSAHDERRRPLSLRLPLTWHYLTQICNQYSAFIMVFCFSTMIMSSNRCNNTRNKEINMMSSASLSVKSRARPVCASKCSLDVSPLSLYQHALFSVSMHLPSAASQANTLRPTRIVLYRTLLPGTHTPFTCVANVSCSTLARFIPSVCRYLVNIWTSCRRSKLLVITASRSMSIGRYWRAREVCSERKAFLICSHSLMLLPTLACICSL